MIASIARGRHGVVTAAELRAAGFSRGGIGRRVAQDRLRPMFRGVYLVGPVEPPHARAAAALLACGPTAVLSHHTAAVLLGLRPPAGGPVDVTVTSPGRRSRPGVRVHARTRLEACDFGWREGMPLTSAPRTLLDLAAELGERELGRALEQAEILRLVDPAAMRELLRRHHGARGPRALRAALGRYDAARLTRSDAEAALLDLIRAAGLPEPECNVRLGRYEVDVLWRPQRLVVEVDGYAYHSTRAAFERDRVRDAELQAAGMRVVRVTWRQITDASPALVARLAAALTVAV